MKAAFTGLPYIHKPPPPKKKQLSVHDNLTAGSEMKDEDNQSPDLIHQAHDQMWGNVFLLMIQYNKSLFYFV